tara:strand:+ start:79 stop:270 length:192 start_codon:yes stop_codon:yes gene_type:complete
MHLTWFYFHCVLALVIIVSDAKGTLEPTINKWEQKVGLYTPPDTSVVEPPYYIPPTQEEKENE